MGKDTSTALVRGGEQPIQLSGYERFTPKEQALVQRTVAKGTTPEELYMFLSVCAHYNLDPFQREMWCIKMPGRNGEEGQLVMIVGKYGWLKVVERRADYQGTHSDVVHEHDHFKKLRAPKKTPTGQFTWVEHEYDVTADRGRLLGAYAEVYREGRPTEFFFAKLDQYQPFSPVRRYDDNQEYDFHGITVFLTKRDLYSPWLSQSDSMILKCAQTTAWRNAFPIGALYGEEEMSSAVAQTVVEEKQPDFEVEYGEDPELAEWIESLFTEANNLVAGAYSPAKTRLLLGGLSDAEREDLARQELIPFIESHGGEVPERGTEVVSDADVEMVVPEVGDEPGEGEPAETIPGV